MSQIGNLKKVPMEDENSSALTLKVLPEYGYVAADEEKTIALMASINSKEVIVEDNRAPLELIVVLDKSGSMSGHKLNLCKETLKFLVNELGPQDKLGVIAFDSHIEERFELMDMDEKGKTFAQNNISKINAGSMTNLSGGLIKGMEWLFESGKNSDKIVTRSIMLLTDGLMNEGIKDSTSLGRIIQNSFTENSKVPITIHAFGYGTDADLNACKAISESGNGMFYNIANIDQVSIAFANCLGGLLAVSAQNISLTYTLSNECTIDGEPLTKYSFTTTEKDNITKITVKIPDMYSEECKSIIFMIKLKKSKESTMSEAAINDLGLFSISYLDVINECMNSFETNVYIQRPLIVLDEEKNQKVIDEKERIHAIEAMEEAKILADNGKLGQARGVIDAMTANLENRGYREDDTSEMGLMMADLAKNSGFMESESTYMRFGKASLQTRSQQHRFQRSADVEYTQSKLFYSNKARESMMDRAKTYFKPSTNTSTAAPSSPKVNTVPPTLKPVIVKKEDENNKSRLSGFFGSLFSSSSSS